MKNLELFPTEETLIETLKENIFNRNKDLLYFYKLLLAQESLSAIAIDGRWGSGKTFFVKQSILIINAKNPMCVMETAKKEEIIKSLNILKKENEINENYDIAIHYDAWENDNDIEPVISIIYEIINQLNITYSFKDDINLFKVAGAIIETISGRNVNGILESLNSEDPIEKFKNQKNLEKKLKTFFSDILKERGNRLVVFIDELDRCKPSYTVELLEQIKHYLCDDRITFVYSVNIKELQHTIKHYYGDLFDACRYLDRFFDLQIALPPVDKTKFYDKIGLNTSYVLEKVTKCFIENYNLELRDITRYYRQIRVAAYEPTHENVKWRTVFPDEKSRQLLLMLVLPIVIGLKIIDINLYDDFINGENPQPLIDILNKKKDYNFILHNLLNEGEAFENKENIKCISSEQKIVELYNAIFVDDYFGVEYSKTLGEYEFNIKSKQILLDASSMLSDYTNLEI